MPPPLFLSYAPPFSADDFAEFRSLVESSEVPLEIDERERAGPQAGLEWLLLTTAFLFIGKSYFDGIFKEVGKDHYQLLKRASKTLYARLVGPSSPAVTVVSTVGKASSVRKYSLLFSLLAEADDGLRFKLLIQEAASEAKYEATVNAFVDFLDAFHRRTLSSEFIAEMQRVRVVGKTMLLAYSKELSRITPVDPLNGSTDA